MNSETQVVYGARAVLEAVRSDWPIQQVYIQKGVRGDLIRQLEISLKEKGLTARYVPAERLAKYTQKNHQGVLADLSPVAYRDYRELIDSAAATGDAPLFLLLDGVTDVRNLGAMIRTAACTGVHGLILPASGSAGVTNDTIKTSAGAAYTLPIARSPHLKDVIYYLQASGIRVVAATEKAPDSIYDTDLRGPVAILMGSEGKGIHPALLKLCELRARLPMKGEIASLNVSVACGVFLYEALRQREH